MATDEISKNDARRHRELYRYMLPLDLVPHEVLPVNEDQTSSHSIHAALQPYCQLTALRCGASKVMLNVMDADTMFFLSQTSMDSEGFGNEEDPVLQACSAAVPLSGRVCEMTIRMVQKSAAPPVFTVPNLADSVFKDLPVVAGPPFFRFYAGTPITTKSGITIGSLAVLDGQPRERLSLVQEAFLGRTAAQIMDVLETRRYALEGRRGVRLGRSLEAFTAGKTTMQSSNKSSTADEIISEAEWYERPKQRSKSVIGDEIKLSGETDNHVDDFSDVADVQPLAGQTVSQTISRAAHLLREALIDSEDTVEVNFVALNSIDTAPITDTLPNMQRRSSLHQATFISSSPSRPEPVLSRDLVAALVQRYPSGCLFDLDEQSCYSPIPDDDDQEILTRQSKTPTNGERNRIEALRSAFSHARQLLFTPMWDSDRASFAYAAFVVSTAETASLSTGTDLSFLNAFCATVMTECSRIEAAKSQKQKSDFVGTMSHEMRSPLHGILASVEFLTETVLDTYQQSLVDTIQSCGRTLLDTINHVLDFSKINTYQKSWQAGNHRTKGLQKRLSRQQDASAPALLQITDVTHVAAVVEEVIETLVTGRDFVSSVEPIGNGLKHEVRQKDHPVKITLDMDHADWTFLTQPGAIRRIIMNLAGNAMKYTSSGSIRVKLQQLVADDVTYMVLTVTDTGCGISQRFIDTKLFTPFSQENALAPGTGLGLSIIQSIITMMNGKITVSSEIGKGTTFQVTLPMERPLPGQTSTQTTPSSGSSGSSLRSNPQLLIERMTSQTSRVMISVCDPELEAVLSRMITEWYGLELVTDKADIRIVDDEDFAATGLEAVLFLGSVSTWRARKRSDKVEFVAIPVGPYRLAKSIQAVLSRRPRSIRGSVDLETIPEAEHISDSLREINLNDGTQGGWSRVVQGTESISIAQDSPAAFNAISPRQEVAESKGGGFPFEHNSTTTANVHNGTHKPRVLVVDDNQINLNLLKNFLTRKRKYSDVDLAEDGQQALDRFIAADYDIVFMDLSMPIMNGFEATRGIRAFESQQSSSGTLIVALTGLAGGRDQAEAFESGVDIYLTKPVSFKLVAEMLDNWEANKKTTKWHHEQTAKELLRNSINPIRAEDAAGALSGMNVPQT